MTRKIVERTGGQNESVMSPQEGGRGGVGIAASFMICLGFFSSFVFNKFSCLQLMGGDI